jgi:hypothetical protein
MKHTWIVLVALLCLALPAAAQFRPVGLPTAVEDGYAAVDAKGNFVVAWVGSPGIVFARIRPSRRATRRAVRRRVGVAPGAWAASTATK